MIGVLVITLILLKAFASVLVATCSIKEPVLQSHMTLFKFWLFYCLIYCLSTKGNLFNCYVGYNSTSFISS